jgi:hypothetical protein
MFYMNQIFNSWRQHMKMHFTTHISIKKYQNLIFNHIYLLNKWFILFHNFLKRFHIFLRMIISIKHKSLNSQIRLILKGNKIHNHLLWWINNMNEESMLWNLIFISIIQTLKSFQKIFQIHPIKIFHQFLSSLLLFFNKTFFYSIIYYLLNLIFHTFDKLFSIYFKT